MRKWLAIILALVTMMGLCACGGSYTAVPDLKLSWDMSPEEVDEIIPVKVNIEQFEDNSYINCPNSDGKLPKVFGQKVLFFDCRFTENKLKNVNIDFDAAVDYETLLKKCTSKYGEPKSIPDIGKMGFGSINVSAVGWTTDTSVIAITYTEMGTHKFLDKMVFYSADVFDALNASEP